MPVSQEELPSTIQRSSEKIKRTYMEALDAAHRQYGDEERAHRTAWSAVKHIAEKKGDRWVLKGRKGPSDPQAAQGGARARRGEGHTHAGVNENKPKRELYEDARRAGIEGRSRMSKHELAEALERAYRRQTDRRRRARR
jgi:cation transport regulator ChaB